MTVRDEGAAILTRAIDEGVAATSIPLPPPGEGVCKDHSSFHIAIEGIRCGVNALLVCKQADMTASRLHATVLHSTPVNRLQLGNLKAAGWPAVITSVVVSAIVGVSLCVWAVVQTRKVLDDNQQVAQQIQQDAKVVAADVKEVKKTREDFIDERTERIAQMIMDKLAAKGIK